MPTAPALGPWVDVTANLVGLPSECGTVSAVGANPHLPTVVAGVALHGLWSTDATTDAWTQLGSGNGSDPVANRVGSIIFDPVAPETFWESGNYGAGGVYVTTDNGLTFRQLGEISHLDALSVDFSDPFRQTLLAGTHERPDLFRSGDGGATWVNVSSGLPPEVGYASQPLVLDSQVHLVGTNAGARSGIFRTADAGRTWQQVYPTGVYGLPVVAASDGAIYWMKQQGGGLVRSGDAGVTWTEVTGPGILASAWTLIEMPDGRLATIGDQHVVVSSDHGVTWEPLGPVFPVGDPFGLTYSAAQNAIYMWRATCDATVPAASIHRLDLAVAGP